MNILKAKTIRAIKQIVSPDLVKIPVMGSNISRRLGMDGIKWSQLSLVEALLVYLAWQAEKGDWQAAYLLDQMMAYFCPQEGLLGCDPEEGDK